eukprot:UN28163
MFSFDNIVSLLLFLFFIEEFSEFIKFFISLLLSELIGSIQFL